MNKIDIIIDALERASNEIHDPTLWTDKVDQALAAARELQAEKQEPFADRRLKVKLGRQYGYVLNGHWFYLQPADEFADQALTEHSGFTAPLKREWVGLTELEIKHYNNRLSGSNVAQEIESKLRERNT